MLQLIKTHGGITFTGRMAKVRKTAKNNKIRSSIICNLFYLKLKKKNLYIPYTRASGIASTK